MGLTLQFPQWQSDVVASSGDLRLISYTIARQKQLPVSFMVFGGYGMCRS